MPLLETIHENDTVLLLWAIVETEAELSSCACLDDRENAYLERLRAPERRKEWLAVRAMLRKGFPDEDLRIAYDVSGIPFLTGDSHSISISHTSGYAAVLLAPFPCGIDVEHAGRDFGRVSSRFLSAHERERFIPEQYGILWCVKEALFKAGARKEVDWACDIEIFTVETDVIRAVYFGISRTLRLYRREDLIIVTCFGER